VCGPPAANDDTKQMPENATQQKLNVVGRDSGKRRNQKAKPKTELWRATETNRLT